MIQLKNISKSFDGGKTFAVKNISLNLASGETMVLLGSSGSGKTTTMNLINRLLEPTSGSIIIDGEDIKNFDPVKLRRQIGYVFQETGLLPHLTIAENVAIVLRLEGYNKKQRRARAWKLLNFVNLDPKIYAKRYPNELSGGQQQRVGVARALANHPQYLLMDEPFAALDPINRDALQEDFLRLQQQLHLTVVFVTHDIFEALRLADQIAVFNHGKLLQVGNKHEILSAPADDFVRELFARPAEQFKKYVGQIL